MRRGVSTVNRPVRGNLDHCSRSISCLCVHNAFALQIFLNGRALYCSRNVPRARQVRAHAIDGRGSAQASHESPVGEFRRHVLRDARYVKKSHEAGIDDKATIMLVIVRLLGKVVSGQLHRVHNSVQINLKDIERRFLWLFAVWIQPWRLVNACGRVFPLVYSHLRW